MVIKKIIKIREQYKGFTYIEMLLVVSLLSITSLALYNTFVSGMKIWYQANQLVVEEDIFLFFDRLSTDLYNSFYFSQINFDGEEDKISFPSILTVLADERGTQKGEYIDQIGKVEYYFDKEDNQIYRRQYNYSEAQNKKTPKARSIAKAINDVKFHYYYQVKGGYEISTTADKLPSLVEVELAFKDSFGKKKTFRKIIDIPIQL